MKTLLIVRHAKSSWADLGQVDFERPLNERGKKDAPEMAKRIKDRKIRVNTVISSPAVRAKKTCKAFCEVLDIDKKDVIFKEELYLPPADIFYKVLHELEDGGKTVIIFSHNPGITEFANTLCREIRVNDMPTCAVFAVKADIRDWKDLKPGENEFLFFDYPKLK